MANEGRKRNGSGRDLEESPPPAAVGASSAEDGTEVPYAAYVARYGRGRLGGSGLLLQLAQRALWQGRAVRLLDCDLKSQTLSTYYPAVPCGSGGGVDGAGRLCTSPRSEDAADVKAFVLSDLDRLTADRISRLLDVSGGDSVLQDLLRDLELPAFCREEGIAFTWLCPLGPDKEDFRHLLRAVERGDVSPSDMLLALNEGAIRNGQNPSGAFDAIIGGADFQAMVGAGAKSIYVPRLPCMDPLREGLLDFYAVAARRHGRRGEPPSPVLAHMTKRWLGVLEAEYERAEAVERLP